MNDDSTSLCRVTFLPSLRSILVPRGTSLFHAARMAGMPIASSCDGEAICGRCVVQVVAGWDSLNAPTREEQRLMKRLRLELESRIACEVVLHGDVAITTGYW